MTIPLCLRDFVSRRRPMCTLRANASNAKFAQKLPGSELGCATRWRKLAHARCASLRERDCVWPNTTQNLVANLRRLTTDPDSDSDRKCQRARVALAMPAR